MQEIELQIAGLGMILYSPPAVAHIEEGTDYLEAHFWEPGDVARHVMDCQLTAFGTGSPGDFKLRFRFGTPDDNAIIQSADFRLRLGLQVRDGTVCVRDLYDLMDWSAECPAEQQLPVPDGWYRLTVSTCCPPSGVIGDHQEIDIVMELVPEKPVLKWEGVPLLCNEQ